MSAFQLIRVASVLLFLAGAATVAQAQQDCECSPFYGCENDLQWFDPVEFELDCSLPDPCGFFFSYERSYWSMTGSRTLIGNPDASAIQQTFIPFPGTPTLPDNPLFVVQPIPLINSIHNSVPRARFALGHRYEFGYNNDGRGWLVGVLDAGDHITAGQIGTDGGMQSSPATPGLAIGIPFGDVVVNWGFQPGFNLGFVDILENTLFNNIPGGRVLPTDANGDGILDGDGFVDDLNGNGIFGSDGIDTDLDGDPDAILPPGLDPDYGDLVALPTTFSTAFFRNSSYTKGIELMRRLKLSNDHMMVKRQHNSFDLLYGVRFIDLQDEFLFQGFGGTIGDSQIDTRIRNNIIGPQLAYKWNHRRGRWLLNSEGRGLFGYNIQNWSQDGFVMEDQIPGSPNHFLQAQHHSFSYGRSESQFAPVGELRLEASYLVTDNIQLKVGWTGTYIGGIQRASDSVRYELPNVGFVDGNTDSTFYNGVNFGIEINQ